MAEKKWVSLGLWGPYEWFKGMYFSKNFRGSLLSSGLCWSDNHCTPTMHLSTKRIQSQHFLSNNSKVFFFGVPQKQMHLPLLIAPLWEQGGIHIDAADARPPGIPAGLRWAWMNWRRSWWRVRSPGPNMFSSHRDLTRVLGPPNGGCLLWELPYFREI